MKIEVIQKKNIDSLEYKIGDVFKHGEDLFTLDYIFSDNKRVIISKLHDTKTRKTSIKQLEKAYIRIGNRQEVGGYEHT